MSTLIIQIGNSDDKLSQKEWSEYISDVANVLYNWSTIHFFGTSIGTAPWQNACWVVEPNVTAEIQKRLTVIRKTYKQDSIAFTVATKTEFI